MLSAVAVAAKLNNLDRQLDPIAANLVTALIGVQPMLLFYVVAAWEDDYTG